MIINSKFIFLTHKSKAIMILKFLRFLRSSKLLLFKASIASLIKNKASILFKHDQNDGNSQKPEFLKITSKAPFVKIQLESLNNSQITPSHFETTSRAKALIDLRKFYSDASFKFKKNFYNMLNYKLQIFYDLAIIANVILNLYTLAYFAMLKNKAQIFFYNQLFRQKFLFDQMLDKIHAYFHTPKNH